MRKHPSHSQKVVPSLWNREPESDSDNSESLERVVSWHDLHPDRDLELVDFGGSSWQNLHSVEEICLGRGDSMVQDLELVGWTSTPHELGPSEDARLMELIAGLPPAYTELAKTGQLTLEYHCDSADDIFCRAGDDSQASVTQLQFCSCCGTGVEVDRGKLATLSDGAGGYQFLGAGLHAVYNPWSSLADVTADLGKKNLHCSVGDMTIVSVEQGFIGMAFDNGQPVLLPPGLHQWQSPTLRFDHSYDTADPSGVVRMGVYTLVTTPEGYSAITQNNGRQVILPGGSVTLLNHRKWEFEKFCAMKIQTDILKRVLATTADNIVLAVDATVTWRITDMDSAARCALQTMACVAEACKTEDLQNKAHDDAALAERVYRRQHGREMTPQEKAHIEEATTIPTASLVLAADHESGQLLPARVVKKLTGGGAGSPQTYLIDWNSEGQPASGRSADTFLGMRSGNTAAVLERLRPEERVFPGGFVVLELPPDAPDSSSWIGRPNPARLILEADLSERKARLQADRLAVVQRAMFLDMDQPAIQHFCQQHAHLSSLGDHPESCRLYSSRKHSFSHSLAGTYASSALDSNMAWQPDLHDDSCWAVLDLGAVKMVHGVLLQGGTADTGCFVTAFDVDTSMGTAQSTKVNKIRSVKERNTHHKRSQDSDSPAQNFAVGDSVRCRDKGEKWRSGAVTKTDPLKVLCEGFSAGFSWDEVEPEDSSFKSDWIAFNDDNDDDNDDDGDDDDFDPDFGVWRARFRDYPSNHADGLKQLCKPKSRGVARYFRQPVAARYVRITPMTWQGGTRPSMRFDVFVVADPNAFGGDGGQDRYPNSPENPLACNSTRSGFACSSCPKRFGTQSALDDHSSSKHQSGSNKHKKKKKTAMTVVHAAKMLRSSNCGAGTHGSNALSQNHETELADLDVDILAVDKQIVANRTQMACEARYFEHRGSHGEQCRRYSSVAGNSKPGTGLAQSTLYSTGSGWVPSKVAGAGEFSGTPAGQGWTGKDVADEARRQQRVYVELASKRQDADTEAVQAALRWYNEKGGIVLDAKATDRLVEDIVDCEDEECDEKTKLQTITDVLMNAKMSLISDDAETAQAYTDDSQPGSTHPDTNSMLALRSLGLRRLKEDCEMDAADILSHIPDPALVGAWEFVEIDLGETKRVSGVVVQPGSNALEGYFCPEISVTLAGSPRDGAFARTWRPAKFLTPDGHVHKGASGVVAGCVEATPSDSDSSSLPNLGGVVGGLDNDGTVERRFEHAVRARYVRFSVRRTFRSNCSAASSAELIALRADVLLADDMVLDGLDEGSDLDEEPMTDEQRADGNRPPFDTSRSNPVDSGDTMPKLRKDVLGQALAAVCAYCGMIRYSESTGESSALEDSHTLATLLAEANAVTQRYGVLITALNLISATPTDNLMNSALSAGASAASAANSVETAARGNAKAMMINATGEANSTVIRAKGDAESNIIMAEGAKLAAEEISLTPLTLELELIEKTGRALSRNGNTTFLYQQQKQKCWPHYSTVMER